VKLREKIGFVLLVMLAFAAPTVAGAIRVWVNGESLTAADLNGNFAHIHNLMVGGHGPRLVNADVSGSANISESKIANGHGIAKAFAYAAECDGGACTLRASQNITSISNTGTGEYGVTLGYTPVNANFVVLVTAKADAPPTGAFATGPQAVCHTESYQTAAPQFLIRCSDAAVRADGGTQIAYQTNFSFAVLDDN
jgi:hypothetical protein